MVEERQRAQSCEERMIAALLGKQGLLPSLTSRSI